MIPKHTVAITLSPNITCVLEAKREQGISAVLKVTGRRSVTLQPHTWKALMGKKELLGAITSCLNVYDEDPVWISKNTPPPPPPSSQHTSSSSLSEESDVVFSV